MTDCVIPFKTQPIAETVVIGDERMGELELPKRYDVTFEEELQVVQLLKALPEGAVPLEISNTINVGLATIAMRRIVPDWSEDRTKQLGCNTLIPKLASYLLDERRGWKTSDPIPSEKKLTGTTTKGKSKTSTAKSSGDSNEPSPETSDSPAITLPDNPST